MQTSKSIWKSILLYYSAILATILVLGGFIASRSGGEFFSNILILPIPIVLWMMIFGRKAQKES